MDDLKEIYRDYLKGLTGIKAVDTEKADKLAQAARSDMGRYLHKELNGDVTAYYGTASSDGYMTKTFASEALAVGYLMDADVEQLDLIDGILREAKEQGQALFENVEEALLFPAPAIEPAPASADETLKILNPNRAREIKFEFALNNGVYDPVHSVYIDPVINDKESGRPLDEPHITFYDVSVDDIEECMAWGTKFLDEVPKQIHVEYGSPEICSIKVSGMSDPTVRNLISTIASDGRWCDVTGLDIGGFNHFKDVIAKNDRIERENEKAEPAAATKGDPWRDGMVRQVKDYMDRIDGLDSVDARDAFPTLADTFEQVDFTEPQIVTDLLDLYSNSDDSGRSVINQMFYTLTDKTFDMFLMEASDECKETLEANRDTFRSQDAPAKGLTQKASASREASDHLQSGRKDVQAVRDENAVGE